jgi:folate-binding protein YgfZ
MSPETTLDQWVQLEGGTLGLLRGQEIILHYGDWTAEYAALKRAAGLVWLGHSTQIEITGADRAAFLNRLCTNKLDGLRPGEGRETFLTDPKGHLLAHVTVFARSGSVVLRTVPGEAEKIMAHLDFYVIRDDVQLHDRSVEWSELLLAGPSAAIRLAGCTTAEPPRDLLAHRELELAGRMVSVRCAETELTPVFWLSMPSDAAAAVWQLLRKTGAAACGRQALEAVRIESGWPTYGQDIGPANLPQEVGRNAQAICFTKGCYLGQETVARIDSHGHVNKRLVGLKFDAAEAPAAGDALSSGSQTVGEVTSAAVAPDFGAAIALGYVRRGFDQPGTRLDGPRGPATVVALPMKEGLGESES